MSCLGLLLWWDDPVDSDLLCGVSVSNSIIPIVVSWLVLLFLVTLLLSVSENFRTGWSDRSFFLRYPRDVLGIDTFMEHHCTLVGFGRYSLLTQASGRLTDARHCQNPFRTSPHLGTLRTRFLTYGAVNLANWYKFTPTLDWWSFIDMLNLSTPFQNKNKNDFEKIYQCQK